MKFSVDVQNFREAIGKVLTVVDKKNSRPILTNCLLKTEKNKLHIVATDLEVSAKIILPSLVEEEGSFCINTKNLADILRELPSGNVNLSADSNSLDLSFKNIKFSLMISGSEEYPQLVFANQTSEFKLKSKQVLEMINKTSHAISTDETRLYLNGIFLQQTNNKLRSVAIDGHRLALLDLSEFLGGNKYLSDGIIIPRKGISEIKKIAESDPEGDVSLSVDDSFMFVNNGKDYFLSVRLIAREYPKYQTVIPAKTSFSFSIDKESILTAVKRIKILANEKTNGIKFKLSANELTVSTSHPSMGQATEKISISYSGKEMDIGFNAKYLLDTLGVLDENEILFELNNELSPVIVRSSSLPDFLGIIMPLKL